MEIPKICRYCGGVVRLAPAAEVYGAAAARRLGIEREKFYQCQNCNARVGCHKGTTRPLGNLANETLRLKRKETHQVFDSFWKERGMTRTQAYHWMAKKLRLSEQLAHIGGFEMDRCQRLIDLCEKERNKEGHSMCEKHYCTHSPETLCSCAPVQSGDVAQIVFHMAENMEDIRWELDYKSLADLRGHRLCAVGKCRQCGGRLCAGQYPVDAQTPEDFLAAVYRQLDQFHRRLDAALSHPAFCGRFAAMFHEEDRPFVEDWLMQRESKIGDKTEGQKAYTIVHTAAYADRGVFPAPDAIATFFDKVLAEKRLRELVEKGKSEMSFPYDESFYCEEYDCQFWEAYCKDYAAGWFIRYEILESPLHEDAKEPCAPREKEV